ncbi:hypothetical protein, partial [Aquimonas sp.]|uniref:hypothetical protein n=1 Tax=Aquimonas sp. TaxID=1872588 RepID=UPI0037C06CFF
ASAHALANPTSLNTASHHSSVWNGCQGRRDEVTAVGGVGGRLPSFCVTDLIATGRGFLLALRSSRRRISGLKRIAKFAASILAELR